MRHAARNDTRTGARAGGTGSCVGRMIPIEPPYCTRRAASVRLSSMNTSSTPSASSASSRAPPPPRRPRRSGTRASTARARRSCTAWRPTSSISSPRAPASTCSISVAARAISPRPSMPRAPRSSASTPRPPRARRRSPALRRLGWPAFVVGDGHGARLRGRVRRGLLERGAALDAAGRRRRARRGARASPGRPVRRGVRRPGSASPRCAPGCPKRCDAAARDPQLGCNGYFHERRRVRGGAGRGGLRRPPRASLRPSDAGRGRRRARHVAGPSCRASKKSWAPSGPRSRARSRRRARPRFFTEARDVRALATRAAGARAGARVWVLDYVRLRVVAGLP